LDAANYTLSLPTGLTADILPLVTPSFTGPGISTVTGGWQLSFAGQAGQSYRVLATQDLSQPLSQWTVVASGTFGSSPVTVTDSTSNLPMRFYVIVSP
jgi:hypothetical protein